MKINTTRFGEIEIDDNSIFEFIMPMIGYDDEDKFVIIDHGEDSPFKWMQSLKSPELAFVMTSAAYFEFDYVIDIPDVAVEKLGITSTEDIIVLNVAAIPNNNPRGTRVNLLAPVILNTKDKKGGQLILSGSGYDVNFPLFKN